ncbi:hypothetical protein QO200_05470 [Flavobacterium sp. Arc3]|uniref:hypothetical protein n=1 Tax=Flavobacterium sp. Arc3 TaxID=3046686 RepID=UPI00352DC775
MSIITNLELQNKFDIATEYSENRNFLIENEIREIDNYVNNIPIQISPFSKEAKLLTINKSLKIYDFGNAYIDRKIFNESFYGYLNNYKQITIERLYNDSDEMYRHKQNTSDQAIEIFKYYEWLKIQLSTPQKAEKKNSLSHKEKMLALYYLGLDMRKFSNNKQSATILSKILGLDESNTKDYLTYFDGNKGKVKTEANINKMLDLFENQDFKEIQKKIKKDLEK